MNTPADAPIVPQQARAALLEVAKHLVAAERALLLLFLGVPLAPIPPNARADDPQDGAPAEVFPLGSYGSLIADLRATLDSFLSFGQGESDQLWTADDATAADSQLPGWRAAARHVIDESELFAGEKRLGALVGLGHLIDAQRDIAVAPDSARFTPVLVLLRQAGAELVKISRAPDGEL